MPNSVIGDPSSNWSTHTVIPDGCTIPSSGEPSLSQSWRGRSVSFSDTSTTVSLPIQSIAEKKENVRTMILTNYKVKKPNKKGLLRRFGSKCVSFIKSRKQEELLSLGRSPKKKETNDPVRGQYNAENLNDIFKSEDELTVPRFSYVSSSTIRTEIPASDHSILQSDEMIAFNELGILDQIQLILKSSKELKEICREKGRNVDCSVITDFVWEIYKIIDESESYQSTVPSTDTMAQVYLEMKERIQFVKRRPIGPIANEQKLILDPIRSNIVLKNGDVIKPRPAQQHV
ncbi:hypothetical protein IWQ51_004121 [Labrenzia sp. EL_142]|nr:hypothetical protein [Labrenzia sp. EL_142]